MQGYSQSAREATRISDLTTIEKALVFFHTTENYFPEPTDFINITYSGSLAWKQWVFGEDTRLVVGRIDESPRDPLTDNLYAYSVTNNRQEFELWAISETPLASINNIFSETYADNNYYSLIKWNYNKQIVTVKEPTRLYILWVPTLITSEITDVTVQDILARGTFSVKNSKSLPASYINNLPEWQTLTGATSFTPWTVTLTAPLIYDGSISNLNDDSEKQIFADNLVSYYQGSNLDNNDRKDLKNVTNWNELAYVNTIIQNNTGGIPGEDIKINTNYDTILGCSDLTWQDVDILNNWYVSFPSRFSTVQETKTQKQWCALENLYLSSSVNIIIPAELGKLSNMKNLSISWNFSSVPWEIANMQSLLSLSLASVWRFPIPQTFAWFSTLKSFTLWAGVEFINSDISSLWSMSWLETLTISWISNIPSQITQLSNLKNLNINQFSWVVTSSIWNTSLESLSIQGINNGVSYGLDITNLPVEIQNISTLESLSLSNANLSIWWTGETIITNAPAWLFNMAWLKTLSFHQLRIPSLDGIENLVDLENLHITTTEISSVPSGIFSLPKLQVLTLRGVFGWVVQGALYQIASLTSLISLDIADSGITILSEEIATLPNLENLYASRNNISTIPVLFKWNTYKRIYLASNPALAGLSVNFFEGYTQDVCENVWENNEQVCIQWWLTGVNIY